MKPILLACLCLLAGVATTGAQEERLFAPDSAAMRARPPSIAIDDGPTTRLIEVPAEPNLQLDTVRGGNSFTVDLTGLEINGAASIGYIGRTDTSGDMVLVGWESVGGNRIVVSNPVDRSAFEVAHSEGDLSVTASSTRNGKTFAALSSYKSGDTIVQVTPDSLTTVFVFRPTERVVDLATQANGDIVVLLNVEDQDLPKVVTITAEGVLVWRSTYDTLLGRGIRARGLLRLPEDELLLVGEVGPSPWAMKLSGEGKPIWERTYLTDTAGGTFFDGEANADRMALAGQAYLGEHTEALVALIDSAGELRWARACGGMRVDETVGATFSSSGGVLAFGTTDSKNWGGRPDFETEPWLLAFDAEGWLRWEISLGLGGTTIFASGSLEHVLSATDRRSFNTVDTMLVPFAAGPGWNGKSLYSFVPRTPAGSAFFQDATTCFDMIATGRQNAGARIEQLPVELLRDRRLQ